MHPGTPRVSVCLPTYNGEEFIAEAIASVLAQSFADFELLIVDDASTDATLDIIHTFTDSRMQVYQNERRLGIPGNWNRCLALAAGEYVCVFHQDDVMLPGNLAQKVGVLQADPTVGFVHSAAELSVAPTAPPTSADWMEKAAENFTVDGHQYFRKLLLQGNVVCAPTVLTRRQLLLDLGGFDENLGFACDYEMWLKLCVEHRVAFLSQPFVRYRWHAKNASHMYRFERGVEELEEAGRRAMHYYLQRTGKQEEGAILGDALTALTKLRRWNAALERGKAWLEEQWTNWQKQAEEQSRVIQEQTGWIRELERGKAWLEEQWANWQRVAEERAKMIQEQQALIHVLEKSKRYLEKQYHIWQKSSWGRLGVRLGVIKPCVSSLPDEEGTER